MILQASYKTEEEVPEGLKEAYVEKNGVFELQVEGMKGQGDVDRLTTALASERTEHRATKSKYGWLPADFDAESLQTLKDSKEDLAHQLANAPKKGMTEDQIEERAEKLAARKTRGLERTIESLTADNSSHLNAIGIHEGAGAQRKIKDSVESSLTGKDAVKVVDSAREDILPFAENIMTINDQGEVVTKENVGFEPGLPFSEVLVDLQASGRRAHWFPGHESAGAKGGKGDATSAINPFKGENPSYDKISAAIRADRPNAIVMANAAGASLRKYGLDTN